MEYSGRREVVKTLVSGTIQQPEYGEYSGLGQDVEDLKSVIGQQPRKTDITSNIESILRSGSGTMK